MSPMKGQKHTEETKRKMREYRINHPESTWLGKKHTPETIEKMKKSSHKADLIGKRFDRLVVISLDHVSEQRQTVWLCKCDCGNEKIASIVELTSGYVKSCGCLRKEMASERGKSSTLEFGKAAANSVLYGYKKSAKIRNLSWEFSDEEFFDITSKNCYYCGCHPSLESKRSKTFNGSFTYNGIDRLDRNLGYTKENSVPCCKSCNYAKGKLNYSDFIELVRKIHKNLCL